MTDWLISQRQIKESFLALPMDIASIYVKNMLWSLSFVTAAQAECVCCSEREKPLCKGPCPTSVSFVQEDICCHCLGKFRALSACAESSVKGEQKRKPLLPFIFKHKGTQTGSVVFPKVLCWHPGNPESKPQLGWDPHPLTCWIFKWRDADLNEELGISLEVEEVYWLLEIVLLPGLCRICEVWHRMYEGSHLNLWSVKIVVWLKNQSDIV